MFDHERMSANRVVFLGLAVAGSAKTDLDERRAESDGAFRLDAHSICGLRMTDDEMEAHVRRGAVTKIIPAAVSPPSPWRR